MTRTMAVAAVVISVAAAAIAAVDLRRAEELSRRLSALQQQVETKPSIPLPQLTGEQSARIRAAVSKAGLPAGFLFAVLSECGAAQGYASDLTLALREGGAVGYAPVCGPVAHAGRRVVLAVNTRGHHVDAATTVAHILRSTLDMADSPIVAPLDLTVEDLVILVRD